MTLCGNVVVCGDHLACPWFPSRLVSSWVVGEVIYLVFDLVKEFWHRIRVALGDNSTIPDASSRAKTDYSIFTIALALYHGLDMAHFIIVWDALACISRRLIAFAILRPAWSRTSMAQVLIG